MYYTTIRKILNNNPCDPIEVIRLAGSIDYNLPIAFKHIYDRTNLQDALWCIKTLDNDNEIQAFALRCVQRVAPFMAARLSNERKQRASWASGAAINSLNRANTTLSNTYRIIWGTQAILWAVRALEWYEDAKLLKQIEQDFLTTFCMGSSHHDH